MKKNIYKLLLVLFLIFAFLPNLTSAVGISESVNSFGQHVYGGTYTPPQQIASLLIRTALTFLGIIAVILILYGGFLYMTAHGKEENVKKGKAIITYAVIGLLIIIAAYGIATLVFNVILNAAGGGVYGGNGSGLGDTGSP